MFQTEFTMPHGHCYLWQADVLWLNVLADALIGLSYFSIPIALVLCLSKFRLLEGPTLKIISLFAGFIFLCGASHFFSIWTVWNPDYHAQGFLKAATGLISFVTALYLWMVLPGIARGKSRIEIEASNIDLAKQLSENVGHLAKQKDQLEQFAIRLKKKRELLKNYECEFRQAIESAPNAMIMISLDRKIAFANEAASELIGQPIKELLGATLDQFIAPDSLQGLEDKVSEIFDTDVQSNQEEISISHSGMTDLKVAIKMTKHQSLEETCVVMSALDLTERAKLIHTLEEKNTALVRSNEDLDDFAYISSHDLKSPLRAIRNLALWVTEDCAGIIPAESSADLERLIQRAKEAETMLAGLHSYAKFSRMDYQITKVTISDIVSKTAGIIDKPESFKVLGPKEDFVFETRSTPFETVVRNLVSNSIKHRSKDNGQVAVNWQVNKDWLTIDVSDNGKGIPETQHEKIFRMYNTGDMPKDGNTSGIGLAIVKKAVEREGGSIRVQNNRDSQGVSFIFTWPVHPAIRSKNKKKPDEVTILYVDDDDIDRRAFKRAMSQKGMSNKILEAGNGKEALQILEDRQTSNEPFIVLVDINMPVMDGHEFVGKLRANPKLNRTIVFMLTTSNNDSDRLRAYQHHVSGYLLKTDIGPSFADRVDMLGKFIDSVEFPPKVSPGL